MSILHLVRRFVGSLNPRRIPADDDLWALEQLLAGERKIWAEMPRADRRHSIGVARDVVSALETHASRPVIAAALLHDSGKIESGLGTYGRVVATLAGAVGGRDMAKLWQSKRGFTRSVGLYLRHDEIGAERLEISGSDPLTIAWTREHHWPEARWTLNPVLARALKAADDD